MYHIAAYSISVFIIVLISGCVLNLLEQHYIFQLGGIAFLLLFAFFKSVSIMQKNIGMPVNELYLILLPVLAGVSACVTSMFLGFWIFTYIRKRFKN